MNGAALASGYSLYNTPDRLAQNLVATNPNATALERYNQYRLGVGHQMSPASSIRAELKSI